MTSSLRLKKLSIAVLGTLCIISCKKNDIQYAGGVINPIYTNNHDGNMISGKVEKGAFQLASTLYITEMDTDLFETGRIFTGLVSDNNGSFAIKAKNVKGNVASIYATGHYYNEVLNKIPESEMSLTAIGKLDSLGIINVNVLTVLERPRVEYLVNQGIPFTAAKAQAIKEVLNVFSLDYPSIKRAEDITLLGKGDQSNILLAISTVVAGFRGDNLITDLINNLAEDLRTDGKLDSADLGSNLISEIPYIDTIDIIANTKKRYAGIYPDSVLNRISFKYLSGFSNKSTYVNKPLVTYEGIFNPDVKEIDATKFQLISGYLQSYSDNLNVTISVSSDYPLRLGTNVNFELRKTQWTFQYKGRNLEIDGLSGYDGQHFDAHLTIKYYYHDNLSTPSRQQTVLVHF